MTGFVVCASCGAQMKAGREYCLRCGEALPPEGEAARVSVWESLQWSQGKLLGLLAVVATVVVGLMVVLWQTQPSPAEEEAQPSSVPSAPREAAPAAESTPPPPTPETAPATATLPPPRGPDDTPASTLDLHQAGSAAFGAGDFEAARKAYEQAIARNPEDADALNNLGQTLVRLERVRDAIPRFERAATVAPGRGAFHFNLAQARASLAQWDRALPEYREAARLSPDDYAVRFGLATALREKGDVAAAIPEYQRAVALNPIDASLHLALGQSLEHVGRTSEAAREYETYIRMAPTAPDVEALKERVKTLSGRSGGAPPP